MNPDSIRCSEARRGCSVCRRAYWKDDTQDESGTRFECPRETSRACQMITFREWEKDREPTEGSAI